MERLDGMDLDEIVRRFGATEPERAVWFLRQACRSLAEAHSMGLVHRDIKPANLFACRLGREYDFLKVLDFGMVKGDLGKQKALLTDAGTATGTPAYMAPEIALGSEVELRADIYSLGCVAYWLLTGQLVFDEENPTQMLLRHVQATPAPPSTVTEEEIPAELEQLVMRCLEKNPHDRIGSADELWAQLGAIDLPPWTEERAQRWWELHAPAAAKQPAPASVDSDTRAPHQGGGG
jgi:serine/threonine-protein kinase